MTENQEARSEVVAKKVMYEFSMFNFLCDKLRSEYQESETFAPGDVTFVGTASSSIEEDRTTFALLESLLLHTRVLHDFFYKQRHLDDIVASDFVTEWETWRPQKDEYLGNPDRKDRLDKALAHLTLRRVEYDSNEKKWNVDAIQEAVENPMNTFLENLPPEIKPWFDTTE